jgi:hypothetical protein
MHEYIATSAAQWGADQELEACCEWLDDTDCDDSQEAAKDLRAAPAEEAGVEVTDEDRNNPSWHELWYFVHEEHGIDSNPALVVAVVRAALERWGPTHPRPIPVGERLPTEADCDRHGRCWLFDTHDEVWLLDQYGPLSANEFWLPAAAIPLPQ